LKESIQTELKAIEYLAVHRDGTIWAAVGPDGQIVVSRKQSRGNWSVPKAINAAVMPEREYNERRAMLAFSPKEHILAVGFDTGTIELWDTSLGALSHKVEGHAGPVKSICFSSDGLRLASGGKDGTLVLWDVASGQEALVLRKQLRDISGVAFSPDNRSLAALEELASKVVIWNTTSAATAD
jgi:WD40 repeat protein